MILLLTLMVGAYSHALEGVAPIEASIYQKNLNYRSQFDLIEANKSLLSSGYAGYYPTLSAVGGWQQNRTDEFSERQKGYLGYLEGRINLFKGFKDQASLGQKNIDLKLSQIDLELQRRELRLQLTEVISDMIYLHQSLVVLQEELKATQSQRQMVAKKVSAGLTGSVDNYELDLRENEIEIEIKQIDQLHFENHQRLIKIFGEDMNDAELDKVTFSSIAQLKMVSNAMTIENNPTFQKAELLKNRYEYQKKEIRSDYLPSLDFAYILGRLTPSEDTPLKFNEYKYGIILTIPLFSGFDTHYKNKAAIQQLSAAEKLRNQSRIEVDSELKTLNKKLSELVALYTINEKKLINSQKYFELTLGEYRRGIKNSPDLVNATDRLFSTKKRRFELLKELEILKVKIENIY